MRNRIRIHKPESLLFLLMALLIIISCKPNSSNIEVEAQSTTASATDNNCSEVTAIEGVYECTGQCIQIGEDGKQKVGNVSGEKDIISKFPGTSQGLYQIAITGQGGFTELEIGALAASTMRTSTADVSDNTYPVLEEYVFDMNDNCQATGYTKIVRNPTKGAFKSCYILCSKVD